MTKFLNKTKEILFGLTLGLSGLWIVFALSFQMYAVFLTVTDQEEKMTRISNEISWRIDGTFKNNPDNIWYVGNEK
jgi:hypothetical protein